MTDSTTELPGDVPAVLDRMAEALRPQLANHPLMVGIHTGGAWVATRLHHRLGLKEPLGTLDISFYRDDFTQVGLHPEVKASTLPVPVDGRHLILVDDVLYTGRTIRAALNEIFDYGRPASVLLACLIERDGRELPIEPQVVGHRMTLPRRRQVKLLGPNPLKLEIQEAAA